jgi:serine/threonine protein kinase
MGNTTSSDAGSDAQAAAAPGPADAGAGAAAHPSSFALPSTFPAHLLASPETFSLWIASLSPDPIFQAYASAARGAGLTAQQLIALGPAEGRVALGGLSDDAHAAVIASGLAAAAAAAAAAENDEGDALHAAPLGRSITNAPDMRFSDYFEFDPSQGGRDFVAKGSTCDVFLCRPISGRGPGAFPFAPDGLPVSLCVKVYNQKVLHANPDFIHKVIDREYAALSALRPPHPNIVRMVHTFKERQPGLPASEYTSVHVVQEYCPGLPADQAILDALPPAEKQRAVETDGGGPELYRYFMQRPRLCDETLRYILYQLLSSVMFLHELDPPLVHRDLKPENVAVWREVTSPSSGACVPCLKLMDFGMARAVPVEDRLRQLRDGAGALMTANTGTHLYMAPEVRRIVAQETAEGDVVPASPRAVAAASVPGPDGNVPIVFSNLALYDWRYDIYSLGILLFVLGTRSVPAPVGLHRDRRAQDRASATLSPLALDLLQRMVAEAPQNRPSARMCLQHRWFDPIREEAKDILGDDTLLSVLGKA